jgi:leader peptidase (prepilin peptidase)/N-methyltransferase
MMEAIIAGVFGLLVGSFLNVCIHRWVRGRSVVKPRSHCVRCRKILAWYDNIPVLSYILLGGRCRYCKRHISIRYPVVELLNAGVWFWLVYTLGVTPVSGKMCLFSSMTIALIFSDLEKRLLPDELTLGGMYLGLALSLFIKVPDFMAAAVIWLAGRLFGANWVLPWWLASFSESVLGAATPAILLWGGAWAWSKIRSAAIRNVGKLKDKKQLEMWDMVGFGDVKQVAMIGSFLGLTGVILTMLIGSLGGSILGSIYCAIKRKKMSEVELPFGTFLGVAALLIALLGTQLLPGAGTK